MERSVEADLERIDTVHDHLAVAFEAIAKAQEELYRVNGLAFNSNTVGIRDDFNVGLRTLRSDLYNKYMTQTWHFARMIDTNWKNLEGSNA